MKSELADYSFYDLLQELEKRSEFLLLLYSNRNPNDPQRQPDDLLFCKRAGYLTPTHTRLLLERANEILDDEIRREDSPSESE
ncbi:MAG: hypothetical protein FD138_749 [Planctomycetota bacterium]|nr:MAG: hypothetical protein FD138_749 [Planctomycetota bacterium]